MTAFVYAVSDPATGRVRYVGSTVDPYGRFNQLRVGGSRAYRNWLSSLSLQGLDPAIVILETVDLAQRYTAESRWIETFRASGEDLLNERDPCRGRRTRAEIRAGVPCSSQQKAEERLYGEITAPRLRAALAQSGKKPGDLKAATGVSAETVSRWLSGCRSPKKSHLRQIALCLAMPVSALID